MELPVAVLNCKPVFGIKTMIVVYKGIHTYHSYNQKVYLNQVKSMTNEINRDLQSCLTWCLNL